MKEALLETYPELRETAKTGAKSEIEELEIEVHKNMEVNPFFKHSVVERLKSLTDHSMDIFKPSVKNKQSYSDVEEYLRWHDPIEAQRLKEESERSKYRVEEEYTKEHKDAAFGKAKRKRAVATCVIKEGSGKITINNREFVEYFPDSQTR